MIRRHWILLPVVLYALTGITQIRPEERVLVRRFGKVVAKPGPGLAIRWPWGIERIDRLPTAVIRRIHVGYNPDAPEDPSGTLTGQCLTGDQNLVNLQMALDYRIGDGLEDLENYRMHSDRIDGIILREAEAILSEWVAARTVDDVLLMGNASLPAHLVATLQDRLENKNLGVWIQQANVIYLAPPDEVRSAFEEVNRAQTQIRTLEFQARQDEARKLRESESLRFELEQQAQSYAENQRTLAQAEAQSFEQRLQKYQQLRQTNPDILRAIWWDEMGKVLLGLKSRGRLDLLDHHFGNDGNDFSQFLTTPKKRP